MKSHSALLLSSLLAAVAVVGRAQTPATAEGETVRLSDYIVETSQATYQLKAPAVTHQILSTDLEALNLPETGDALQYLPNLFIRKRFVGDKNSLTSIRGTSNRQPGRTIVYADGVLLSNFLGTGFGNSPRWFLIAPEEIQKIAVSYGPYSALYAGNSIGGTVLISTTLPLSPIADAKVQYMAQDFREYGTKDTFTGTTAYAAFGNRYGKFSFFSFYNRLKNDSHPMTFATINGSATAGPGTGGTVVTGASADTDFSNNPRFIYGSQGPTEAVHDLFKVKLGYDFSDHLLLRYTLAYWINQENNLAPESYLKDATGATVWNGKVEFAGRTFTIPTNAFTVNERRQADVINALTLAYEPADGLSLTVTGSLYDVLKDKTYAATTNYPTALAGGAGQATIVGRTGWQNLDAMAGWRGPRGSLLGSHAFVLGYHFDRYFTAQDQWAMTNWRDATSRTALNNGTGGKTATQAVFAQDTWTPRPSWTVTAGARWESWEAYAGTRSRDFSGVRTTAAYPERAASAWSPKLAVSWQPVPAWTARLSLAKATRFPTVGELFQGSVSASGSITASDPNLKPERDFAKDLTVERALSGGLLRFSLFEEDVRDSLINQSSVLPGGASFTGVQNVARVRARGAEAAFNRRQFLIPALDLDVNASYTNALILENPGLLSSIGRQFPRIPHWQVKSMVSWRAHRALTLSAAGRYSSHQFNTLDNSDPFGGYGGNDNFLVVDLKAAVTLRKGLTASLGIDNVSDRRYHVFHPMPGRTWFAELKWKF